MDANMLAISNNRENFKLEQEPLKGKVKNLEKFKAEIRKVKNKKYNKKGNKKEIEESIINENLINLLMLIIDIPKDQLLELDFTNLSVEGDKKIDLKSNNVKQSLLSQIKFVLENNIDESKELALDNSFEELVKNNLDIEDLNLNNLDLNLKNLDQVINNFYINTDNENIKSKDDILSILNLIKDKLEDLPVENEFKSLNNDSKLAIRNYLIKDKQIDKNNYKNFDKDVLQAEDTNLEIAINTEKSSNDTNSYNFEGELDNLEKQENKEDVVLALTNRIDNKIIEYTKIDEKVFLDNNIEKIEDSILQMIKLVKEDNTSTMKLELYPKDLGSLDITLTMEDGVISAKLLVDSENIKGLFLENIDKLNESLSMQDIQISNFQVDVNSGKKEQEFEDKKKKLKNRNLNLKGIRNINENIVINHVEDYINSDLNVLV